MKHKYPLNQIYFYLTEGCNLRCRHCWIAPKYQTGSQTYKTLDPDLFRKILEQGKLLGISGVKLTGGEPLLHPEIRDILEIVRNEDLCLNVETNGVLCTFELARAMATCKNPFVSVSLDGADADTHEWVRGVEGCFDACLEGIRNLVQAGLHPQVIMTVMRRNKDQMESVLRIAERLGADSIKFNVVEPTARGGKMHKSGEALSIGDLVDLGRWAEEALSASTRLTVNYSHPPAFRPLGRMFSENGDGCNVCGILNILGVLADGSYALCGIGETVHDLVFGHAALEPLKEIWENTPVLLELREGLPHRLEGICSACIMKGICLGSCIAQNYYRSKNIWSPFWYCEDALNQGLFPETRMKVSRYSNCTGKKECLKMDNPKGPEDRSITKDRIENEPVSNEIPVI